MVPTSAGGQFSKLLMDSRSRSRLQQRAPSKATRRMREKNALHRLFFLAADRHLPWAGADGCWRRRDGLLCKEDPPSRLLPPGERAQGCYAARRRCSKGRGGTYSHRLGAPTRSGPLAVVLQCRSSRGRHPRNMGVSASEHRSASSSTSSVADTLRVRHSLSRVSTPGGARDTEGNRYRRRSDSHGEIRSLREPVIPPLRDRTSLLATV